MPKTTKKKKPRRRRGSLSLSVYQRAISEEEPMHGGEEARATPPFGPAIWRVCAAPRALFLFLSPAKGKRTGRPVACLALYSNSEIMEARARLALRGDHRNYPNGNSL